MRKINHLIVTVLILCGCSAQTQQELQSLEGKVEVEGGEIWYKVMGDEEGFQF